MTAIQQALALRTPEEQALTEPRVIDHMHGDYSVTTTCGRHYAIAERDEAIYVSAETANKTWVDLYDTERLTVEAIIDDLEYCDTEEAMKALGVECGDRFLALYDTNVPAAWAYAEQMLAGRIERRAA